MSIRLKNFLIFGITILLAAGVYAWFYPLNKGTLMVKTDLSNYFIFTDDISIQCDQDPCEISLKTGAYNIKIQKDNYFPESINIYIKRWKVNEVKAELRKIPNLKISPIIPLDQESKITKLPEDLKDLSLFAPTWDRSEKKLAFIERKDNRLKIWEENKETKTITTLKDLKEGFTLYWAPNLNYLFGNVQEEIYFIDTLSATRKKEVLNFIPKNPSWSLNSEYLLVNDDKEALYKINFSEKTIDPLETTLNLNNAVWSSDSTLVLFTYDKAEKKATISSFNPITQEKEEILIKYNFPISKISSDANKIVYFYNPNQETWYYLDY